MSMEALIDAQLLIDNFNRRGNEIPEKLHKLVTEVSMIVQGNIQDEAPVVTGNLQSSIRREYLGNFSYRIFPDEGIAPYAYFILKGTEPHEIRPKGQGTFHAGQQLTKGAALWWPGLDHPVAKVNHPGTKANPFFDRGIQNSKSDIQAEVESFKNWLTGESDDY